MALDGSSHAEHNGGIDRLGSQAETVTVEKATAVGAFQLYDVRPTISEGNRHTT